MTDPPDTLVLETSSVSETEALGRCVAKLLPVPALVALRGELAAGKTCLVRGMAVRFARGEAVTSPTFTFVNEYGDNPRMHHLDLYRISDPAELADLGYEELFDPDDGVSVVEWSERAEALLPDRRVDILLEHAGGDRRAIRISNWGVLAPGWQALLARPADPVEA
jgi:tRNA threonylcarbamoyladenosine biosynthesis protein TsaE